MTILQRCTVWVEYCRMSKENAAAALIERVRKFLVLGFPLVYSWPHEKAVMGGPFLLYALYGNLHRHINDTQTDPLRYDEQILLCLRCSFTAKPTPGDSRLIRGFSPWANRPQKQWAMPRLLIIIITVTLPTDAILAFLSINLFRFTPGKQSGKRHREGRGVVVASCDILAL